MTTYGVDPDPETQAFLDEMLPRQLSAERAIHDGDAEPRKALWSRRDPVTLLGADMDHVQGWAAVGPAFDEVASWFSDCTSYDVEIVAAGASGGLAYTTGFEHSSTIVQGVPRSYRLRVTHVYRREDGEWRIVHRHGDRGPAPA
jgi:ketosteroid isomerase-like protein